MIPRFKVGQSVAPATPGRSHPDVYVIVRVLPETSCEPQYCVEGLSSGCRCIVCETQIREVGEQSPRPGEPQPLAGGGSIAQGIWC
jgi:hypothetical protein